MVDIDRLIISEQVTNYAQNHFLSKLVKMNGPQRTAVSRKEVCTKIWQWALALVR